MLDRLLAIMALALLCAFVGIVLYFVQEPDLIIICVIVLAMAVADFYLTLSRRKQNGGS